MRRFIFIVIVVTFAVAIFGPILRGRSAERLQTVAPKAQPEALFIWPGSAAG